MQAHFGGSGYFGRIRILAHIGRIDDQNPDVLVGSGYFDRNQIFWSDSDSFCTEYRLISARSVDPDIWIFTELGLERHYFFFRFDPNPVFPWGRIK